MKCFNDAVICIVYPLPHFYLQFSALSTNYIYIYIYIYIYYNIFNEFVF